jgi:hypothetical protein
MTSLAGDELYSAMLRSIHDDAALYWWNRIIVHFGVDLFT